MSDNVFGFVSY